MVEQRARQVEELVESVDGGLCVDIEGLPCSGRSTLLQALSEGLRERGRQVVRIDGIRALRDQPLGAVSAREKSSTQPRGVSVRDVTRQLVRELGSGRSVLVIDDVDDLDRLSSGIAHAARVELEMPVAVTRRLGTDRDEVVRDFVSALQPGVLVHLNPLSFADVHQVLHDELHNPIDSELVAHIAVMAGGLPGLVKAYATAARVEGRIASVRGVWRAVTDLWPPSVGHALAPLLRDLEQEDVRALTFLSLAGTRSVARTGWLVDLDRLQRLERLGLVAVTEESGSEALAVVPPALSEHLARECGPLGRRAYEALVAANELAPARVTASAPAARGSNLQVSLAAKRLSDHWDAEHSVLQIRWTEDPTAARAVPLTVAKLVLGASPEQVVRSTRPGPGPDEAQLHAWFVVYLGMHRHDMPAARRYVAAVCADSAQALASATLEYLDLLYDRVPAADVLVPTLAGASSLEAGVLQQVRVEREVAAGNVRTARSVAEERPACRLLVRHLDVALLLARILDGEVGAGTDAAVEAMAGAMRQADPGSVQAYAYVAALGMTLGGRFTELDALVGSALTVTTRTPVEEHYRAGVVTLAAIAARWQGRRTFARRLAFQGRALDDRAGPFPGMMPGQLPAIARGGGERSADDLWAFADERLSKGYTAAGTFYGVAALEVHPDPRWAASIWSAVGSSESVVLRALAGYAVALGATDPDALEASRSDLAALGLRTYEARALISEAITRRQRGSHDRALQSVESAWELTTTFGGPQAGFFEPFITALKLSAREFAIIEMIASGLTTNEVASELSISPRTVENHVFSCYRKTGIGSREDMSRAVYTWLTPPSV